MKKVLGGIFLLCICLGSLMAQEEVLYKQIDSTKLYLEVHFPENYQMKKDLPAIVFFFGGGWNNGNRAQFRNHALYFAQRGAVCFLADYRVKTKHGTSPFQAVEDAKSAMRFIRENADTFKIDPTKIVASGGSAGGHLAAATAMVNTYNAPTDKLGISCKPDALILFNPVIDNGPGGYGFERIGKAYKEFSPLHVLDKAVPPTIFFLGTKDALIPVETAQYYKVVMEKVGSRCDLFLYENQKHGFFNYQNLDMYQKTLAEADKFLISLGLLDKEPVIEIK